MSGRAEFLQVRVNAIRYEAAGIHSWELTPVGGERILPPFTAGAHVDLRLRNGLIRSYSLTNPQDERHRYVVAIRRDEAGTGGSKFIHEQLRVGEVLEISAPRNHFTLVEDAGHVVFIAGGIGITPIRCMIQRLEQLGRSWELHYVARTREACAYLDEFLALEARRPGRVHLTFDHEPGGKMLDLPLLVRSLPTEPHLYCCGPKPMLLAFEEACSGRPADHVHLEYFSPKAEAATDVAFTVVLASSGRELHIPAGRTILDVLLDERIDVSFACTNGVCGACETQVLEGEPDHRDSVLTPEQQAGNRTMMICCSGSKTARLVLAL